MDEQGKKLKDIAPEVVEDTDAPVLDIAIEIALGHIPNAAEIEALDNPSEQDAQFAEKIVRINDEIQAFLDTVDTRIEAGKGNRAQIREALRLMLKVHIEQSDRADTGLPFISHPIAVARDTLTMCEGDDDEKRDMCIAALLHDSIEDQSRLLALEEELDVERGHGDKKKDKKIRDEILHREGAIGGIEWLFGRRVRFLVESLTSPLKLDDGLTPEEKNKIYRNYIEGIFINQDSSPSVIKWADLKQNALTIGLIRERAEKMREEGNIEFAEKLEGTYQKLRTKYKPVLEAVKTFFNNLTDEHHPLFKKKDGIVASIEEVLHTEYNT